MKITENDSCPHFLILFRDSNKQYRGFYGYNPETSDIFWLHGTGPKTIVEAMFDNYYSYDTSGKKFTKNNGNIALTAAFTIKDKFWNKNKHKEIWTNK